MKETVKSHGPIGGAGKTIEADETYIGTKDAKRPAIRKDTGKKMALGDDAETHPEEDGAPEPSVSLTGAPDTNQEAEKMPPP